MFAEQSPESVELVSKRKYMQKNQSWKYIIDAIRSWRIRITDHADERTQNYRLSYGGVF